MSGFISFEIDGVNELKNMFENLTDEVKKTSPRASPKRNHR